jgi:hypothetical protein
MRKGTVEVVRFSFTLTAGDNIMYHVVHEKTPNCLSAVNNVALSYGITRGDRKRRENTFYDDLKQRSKP